MSKYHEQATQLLQKATQDTLVLTKLGSATDIAIEVLGFHVKQAAEKILKAALCATNGILYRQHWMRSDI